MARKMRSRALMGAAALAFAPAFLNMAPAFAQDDVDEIEEREEAEEVDGDTIVVTGSRIRRQIDTTVDVTSIGSVEITNRGFTNVIEGIEQLPFVGAGVNNTGGNVQFGDNSAFPDLLNFGTQRTLSLVNGQRFVSSNQATVFVPGNANGAQVDLTVINPALVERTELLTVGGGPIYGADAVAGVVNIILKDDFEGLNVVAQGGLTSRGDGGNYRISGAWGQNFLDGRANVTIAGEFVDSDGIRGRIGGSRIADQNAGTFLNPFSLNANDGQPSTINVPNANNPFQSINGLVTSAQILGGSPATNFFPEQANAAFPDGLSPFQFAQTPAGSAIDPLLFVGTFSPSGTFLTVPNTDAATNGFLPTRAVPLQFNANGDLVAFNIGDISPPNPAEQNLVIGGDGLNTVPFINLRSAQERITFNLLSKYEFNDNLRAKVNFIFANITNESIDAPLSNNPLGNTTAGNQSIPVFIDQNPFLSAQSVATLDDLEAQGATFGDIGGERVVFLSRNLLDVTGPVISGNEQRTFRGSGILEGDFEAIGRDFNWDIGFVFGRTTSDNFDENVLDVEFALATDVVQGPNGPVCRQQTLDAPEPIGVRNPGLAFINSGLPAPVTPTQAQIDACQPLNLFGFGSPSQAAIDNVTASVDSRNESQQIVASASLGGTVFELPAGPFQFNSQFEYRRESNEFNPGVVFGQGLARNTLGQSSQGTLQFFEGGTEIVVPVFGDGFSPYLFKTLELNGAVRVVNRSISSENNPNALLAPSPTDVTFTAGGRWSPFDGVTFRGNRTRAVRSPSVVELVGAGVTGFTGGADSDFACDEDNIDGGPAGGIRRANCETFVQSLGLPISFLDGFNIPGGTARPAAGSSNVGLNNEVSDSWTVGIVLQPSFIPGLTIEADWLSIDLDGTLALSFQVNNCFDQESFPNSLVGGFNTCESFVPAVEDPNNPGAFIVPSVNPVTGNPVSPFANPGSPAPQQAAGNVAFVFFPTLNTGAQSLRGLTTSVNYTFDIADVVDLGLGFDPGTISTRGFVYYVDRFDVFPAGFGGPSNPSAGEPGNSHFETRLDFSHNIGKLTHTLQWFRDSETRANVLNPPNDFGFADQTAGFVTPAFNRFNYNIRYDINDNFTARFIVNNLTDARTNEDFFIAGDIIGRTFVGSIEFNF